MKLSFKIFVLLLGLWPSLQSCTDFDFINDVSNNQNFRKWEGNLNNIPLGYLAYKSDDIIEELSNTSKEMKTAVNGDGLYVLTYTKSIKSDTKKIKIEKTINRFNKKIELPNPIKSTIGSGIYTIRSGDPIAGDKTSDETVTEDLKFAKKFSKVFFSDGQVIMNFVSSLNSETTVKIILYSLKDKTNGRVFSRNLVFTKANNTKTITLDLRRYELDLTHDGTAYNKTYNEFSIRTETIFKFKVGETIQKTDKIEYSVELKNLKNTLVYGDFDKDTFDVKKHTFKIFKDLAVDSKITFADPKLTIEGTNRYGANIGLALSGIKGTKINSSTNLIYKPNKINEIPFVIQSATYNNGVVPKITKGVIDKNNSNFHTLLSKSDRLEFDLVGELNPNSVSGTANNNFYDNENGGINIDIEVKIPLILTIKNFKVEKSFKLKKIKNLESVKELDLIFRILNSMPFGGSLEIFLLDNYGNELLAGKKRYFKGTDTFDSEGRVTKRLDQTLKITLQKKEVEKIKTLRKIKIISSFTSVGSNPVKMLDKSLLDINLSIDAKINYKYSKTEYSNQ